MIVRVDGGDGEANWGSCLTMFAMSAHQKLGLQNCMFLSKKSKHLNYISRGTLYNNSPRLHNNCQSHETRIVILTEPPCYGSTKNIL